jgi:hypothetical protein
MKLHQLSTGRRQQESAFTLAEVVVSVLILTIVTIGIYGGFSFGFLTVRNTREDLRATQIMVQKAEAVHISNWSDLVSNCPISFQEWYDPAGSVSNAGGVLYYGTLSATSATNIPNSSTYQSNVLLMTTTLNWTNYNGNKTIPHSRQMQTLVARYGLQGYLWGMP